MYKLTHIQKNQYKAFLSATNPVFAAISLIALFIGVSGIVEHKSPENMVSLITLGISFCAYFQYHILIITGALGFTSTVWFMGNIK